MTARHHRNLPHAEPDLPHGEHAFTLRCTACKAESWAGWKARLGAWEARRDAFVPGGSRTYKVTQTIFGLLLMASPFILVASGSILGLFEGAANLTVLRWYPELALLDVSGAVKAFAVGVVVVLVLEAAMWPEPSFSEPPPKMTAIEYQSFDLPVKRKEPEDNRDYYDMYPPGTPGGSWPVPISRAPRRASVYQRGVIQTWPQSGPDQLPW